MGDITNINGAEINPVWVVTGGSPCQDLSIAGKRAGLAGARSGLFMEQVRIVKEMRAEDKRNGRTGRDVNKMQLEKIGAIMRADYAEAHPWRNLWAWVKRKLVRHE